MKEQLESILTDLSDIYINKPILKSLIQLISISGIPIGSLFDTSLITCVNNIKANRLRIFFDELNSGQIELTADIIEQNDFLSAYFSTLNYVIRTRSDEKIKCFARVLKKLNSGSIDINEFEDYTSIFNELSEREFYILSIMFEYEQAYSQDRKDLNPLEFTCLFWPQFVDKIYREIDLDRLELESMLIRIQRTGCYNRHNGYFNGAAEKGYTTVLFERIYILIQKE